MESKFKFRVGEIVRQVRDVYSDEDPICKIIEIKGNKIYHIHRNKVKEIRRADNQMHPNSFRPLPKLLRILYDF